MARAKLSATPRPLPDQVISRLEDLIGVTPGQGRGPESSTLIDQVEELREEVAHKDRVIENLEEKFAGLDEGHRALSERIAAQDENITALSEIIANAGLNVTPPQYPDESDSTEQEHLDVGEDGVNPDPPLDEDEGE